jgi:RNA polymerase sigma factor (sigma-70 family)
MPVSRLTHVVTQLSLADDARSDSDLLTQFLTLRDERAFAILIHRHTPGVRAVCRGWLRSAADIDDATQATFLVLLRRAETIRDRSMLGYWLYRTAGFVARRLKQHVNRTGPLPDDLHAQTDIRHNDERAIVTAEIGRLPEPYRLAIQLHYEAGLTAAAMADRLNCPRSTVLSRLTRGRSILRRRLLARGVAPAVLASPVGVGLTVSPSCAVAFARSALAFQTGGSSIAVKLSTRSVSLSEGVVRAMMWKNFQILAVVAMIATGLSAFLLGQWASADGPKKTVEAVSIAAQQGKPNADEPAIPGGRREAVIRMPVGTFVKEVEVQPYGSGRITWTYENDRVRGQISLSGMGRKWNCQPNPKSRWPAMAPSTAS